MRSLRNGYSMVAAIIVVALLLAACSTSPAPPPVTVQKTPTVVLAGGEPILPHLQVFFHDAPLPTAADLHYNAGDWTVEGYDNLATHAVALPACCASQAPVPRWFLSLGSPLLFAPVVSNNRIYLAGSDGYLHVLSVQTGQEQWRVSIGGELTANGLALANGLVYVALAGHYIGALDASTGQLRWQFDTGGVVRAAPMVVGRDLLVSSGSNSLFCLDALTGVEDWLFHSEDALTEFWPTHTPPAVSNGLVYVALGASNEFNALSLRTGRKVWESSLSERMTGGPMIDEALGLVYVVTWSGHLVALDAQTGKFRWDAHIPGGSESSPALSLRLGTLYVGSFDGNLYAYDASTGHLQWQAKVGSSITVTPLVVQMTTQNW